MNNFQVVQIGDITSNGNRIVKIQRKIEIEDEFGISSTSETYYRTVQAESVKVQVGQEMPNFNPDNYQVVARKSEMLDKDTGEKITVTLKWLHNKTV